MNPIALHHIVINHPALAEHVLKELALGGDFGHLAEEFSICPSAAQEGYAGLHDIDALPDALVAALYAPENADSAYIGPVKTTFGVHILKPIEGLKRPLLMDLEWSEEDQS